MATVAELQAFRARLQEARYTGVRELRDADGSAVVYKSDAEFAKAIAAVEMELAWATKPPAFPLYLASSKGLD